jgi:hypothetical protein
MVSNKIGTWDVDNTLKALISCNKCIGEWYRWSVMKLGWARAMIWRGFSDVIEEKWKAILARV